MSPPLHLAMTPGLIVIAIILKPSLSGDFLTAEQPIMETLY